MVCETRNHPLQGSYQLRLTQRRLRKHGSQLIHHPVDCLQGRAGGIGDDTQATEPLLVTLVAIGIKLFVGLLAGGIRTKIIDRIGERLVLHHSPLCCPEGCQLPRFFFALAMVGG